VRWRIASMRAVISAKPLLPGEPHGHALVARQEAVARDGPVGAPRREKNGAPGGIALKPCGEGCQRSTSSGGSARCRKSENQPKSVLAMKAAVAARGLMAWRA